MSPQEKPPARDPTRPSEKAAAAVAFSPVHLSVRAAIDIFAFDEGGLPPLFESARLPWDAATAEEIISEASAKFAAIYASRGDGFEYTLNEKRRTELVVFLQKLVRHHKRKLWASNLASVTTAPEPKAAFSP